MIQAATIEQYRRAELRYAQDQPRRNERRRQVQQLLRRTDHVDWQRIDEPGRVRARARMLNVDLDEREPGRDPIRFLERVIDKDELLSADFLRVGAQVSLCVGRVHIRDPHRRRAGYGTAFLISERLLMTNHHVLPSFEYAAASTLELDYVEGLIDSARPSSFFDLDPATFFLTSPGLDYSIVALAPEYDAGEAQRRAWLPLIAESGKLLVGERLNIIQHPRGGPQRAALRANQLESLTGSFLVYSTDTDPGSSGSPVCNDEWQLAALHHASVPERDAGGRVIRWLANEGVRVSHIVADARQRLRGERERWEPLLERAFQHPVARGVGERAAPAPAAPVLSIQVQLGTGSSADAFRLVPLAAGADPAAVATAPASARAPAATPIPAEDDLLEPPSGLPAFSRPELECIVVRLAEGSDERTLDGVGDGWERRPVEHGELAFDVIPGERVDVARAWDVVHELRALEGVVSAEPSFEIDSVVEEERAAGQELFGLRTATDRAEEHRRWAPELIDVERAWELEPPVGGVQRGRGIRVAHPDSGYTRHPELVERADAFDLESGFDFVDEDSDELDEDGFHGTGTASVMMSGADREILGVAPEVTLVPMRVAQKGVVRPAPVLLRAGTVRLRRAIHRAVDTGCHVVSISLGWLGNSELHRAVRRAWDEDVIVVAAAGNYTRRFIVWPARYPESICMAGCDARRGTWGGSARGSRVDFTGPAQDVWKAGFGEDGRPCVMQSSGTSFATAMTAGLAALWLGFFGRDRLRETYRPHGVRLTEVFRAAVERSADPPPRSLLGGFGGIVNARRLLETPLPDPREVLVSSEAALAERSAAIAESERPNLAAAVSILGESYSVGRRRIADALGVTEDEVEALARGCGDELAFHTLLASRGPAGLARESSAAPVLDPALMSGLLRTRLATTRARG